MGINFTPFMMITTVIFILISTLAIVLMSKGWTKSSLSIIAVMVIVAWTKPFQLTTETQQVNAQRDQLMMEQHETNLKELPPRVTVERKSYDEYLAEEEAKLTQKSSTHETH